MRYSIIVPVYNAATFLNACIESVRMQAVDDWELLLIDDGSTDGSGAMADAWASRDERIRVLHQLNQGQFFARQAGIDAAEGDYLLFLDSDDRWEAECLSKLNAALERTNPDILLFAARIFEAGEDTGRVIGRFSPHAQAISPEELRRSLLTSNDLNSLCLKAFRRELFSGDEADYSAFAAPQCGEDKVRLLYPVSNAKKIFSIPDTLYQYHHRTESVMHQMALSSAQRMLSNEMFAMLRRALSEWDMNTPENNDLLDAYYLRNFLSVYYGMKRSAQTAQSRKALHSYPWREQIYLPAFCFRAVRRLNARDQIRLAAAMVYL